MALHSRQPFTYEDNDAELEIVVKPDFRGRGIGKRLLGIAIQYAENRTRLSRLVAKIPTGNYASKSLCEDFGFLLQHKEPKGFVMTLKIAR